MGRIVIASNVTLDGVVQDPDGAEGFKHGGWFEQFGGDDRAEWARVLTQEALGADALLLGRRTEEWLASRWLPRTGEWADRLNTMPKYVVSSTLKQPSWSNATVLTGEVVSEVSKLKQTVGGDIVVYASYQLVRALMDFDLADEVRLIVVPVVLGAGERIFGEIAASKGMRLVEVRALGERLAYVSYQFERAA